MNLTVARFRHLTVGAVPAATLQPVPRRFPRVRLDEPIDLGSPQLEKVIFPEGTSVHGDEDPDRLIDAYLEAVGNPAARAVPPEHPVVAAFIASMCSAVRGEPPFTKLRDDGLVAWTESGRRGWVRLAVVPAPNWDAHVLAGVLAEDRR